MNPNSSESYLNSPGWKATTNPINKKDKCFQYVTVGLNHEEIAKMLKE